ncbi:hypothetical protein [Nocardia thailandica]
MGQRVDALNQSSDQVAHARRRVSTWTGDAATTAWARFDALESTLRTGIARDGEIQRRWTTDAETLSDIKTKLQRLDDEVARAGLIMDNTGRISKTSDNPQGGVSIVDLEREAEAVIALATALESTAIATFKAVAEGTLI